MEFTDLRQSHYLISNTASDNYLCKIVKTDYDVMNFH